MLRKKCQLIKLMAIAFYYFILTMVLIFIKIFEINRFAARNVKTLLRILLLLLLIVIIFRPPSQSSQMMLTTRGVIIFQISQVIERRVYQNEELCILSEEYSLTTMRCRTLPLSAYCAQGIQPRGRRLQPPQH